MSQTKDSFDNAANNNADSVMRVENGDKVWRNAKGQPHRTDGPAFERANGSKAWRVNGQLHRTDGPAYERADGGKTWWMNGQLHRTDGPAIESADGGKSWWINDQRHRTDGPAIEETNGYKAWWINGNELTEQEFNAHPLVLEAQRQKKAEKAEEATRKAEYDHRMRQVIRDFHAKIRRPS